MKFRLHALFVVTVVSTAESNGNALDAGASTNHAKALQFNSPNDPKVTRNDIGDPGNITRQLLDRFGTFLHRYHEQPVVEDVPDPVVTGPLDVIVKIGGAGVCRTDLHIIEEQWADKSGVKLPTRSATRTPVGCNRSAPR